MLYLDSCTVASTSKRTAACAASLYYTVRFCTKYTAGWSMKRLRAVLCFRRTSPCMILYIRCSRCGGISVKRQREETRLSAASCEGEWHACVLQSRLAEAQCSSFGGCALRRRAAFAAGIQTSSMWETTMCSRPRPAWTHMYSSGRGARVRERQTCLQGARGLSVPPRTGRQDPPRGVEHAGDVHHPYDECNAWDRLAEQLHVVPLDCVRVQRRHQN